MELPSPLLNPISKKIKKSTPIKFLYFRKWNFLAPRLKNSLYFGKLNFMVLILKNFLYFFKRNPEKVLIYQETGLSYISGNRNPKKLLIFQKVIFRSRKIKKPTLKNLFILREMELSSSHKKLNKTF